MVKPKAKKADIVNDACRTFTFFNIDSYIFNDIDDEVKDQGPSFSDESGYLSESELVVDDSDWINDLTIYLNIWSKENGTRVHLIVDGLFCLA